MSAARPLTGPVWRVQLLGGVCLFNGADATELPARLALLLARLALYARTMHPREELAELLWPERPPADGRNSLRNALSRLRGVLEPTGTPRGSVLVARPRQVWLQPDAVLCDAAEFERLLRAGETEAARALYGGELMPGFFDDWVLEERRRWAALLDSLDGRPASLAPATRATRRLLRPDDGAFFGRDAEQQRLLRLLAAHRLVTIAGMGGCGKTRLAGRVAWRIGGVDLAAFVPLGDCLAAAQVLARVGDVLGLPRLPPPQPPHPPAQLQAHLAGSDALLVLDNVEQLESPAFGELLSDLLERLPRVRLLLTSRVPLRRADEQVLALAPLPLPLPGAEAGNPCIALYERCAQASRDEFRVRDGNRADIAALCCALGGLPLAIELAASQLRQRGPAQMLASVRREPEVLARRGARALQEPRHASLTAVVAASWDLLDARRRAILAAVAVCADGCTPGQAARIAGLSAPSAGDDSLAWHALLLRDAASGRLSVPPGVLGVMRRLPPEPEQARLALRHRACFVADAQAWYRRAERVPDDDLGNLLQALDGALAAGEVPEGGVLLVTAQSLLQADRPDDATRRVQAALALAPAGSAAAADALLADVSTRWRRFRDAEAEAPRAAHALACALALDDARRRVNARLQLGAVLLGLEGQVAAASAAFRLAEAEARAAGDALGALLALPGHVTCLMANDRLADAAAMAAEGEARAAALAHVETQLLLQNRQAVVLEALRDFEGTLAACRRQGRLAAQHRMRYHLLYAMWNQARPLLRVRRAVDAARLLAYSRNAWVSTIGPLSADDERYVARAARLGASLLGGTARWQRAWQEGEQLGEAEATALAIGEPPPV